jgi:hypothetical protein
MTDNNKITNNPGDSNIEMIERMEKLISINEKKEDMLQKLDRLTRYGVKLSKCYSMESSYDELSDEYIYQMKHYSDKNEQKHKNKIKALAKLTLKIHYDKEYEECDDQEYEEYADQEYDELLDIILDHPDGMKLLTSIMKINTDMGCSIL